MTKKSRVCRSQDKEYAAAANADGLVQVRIKNQNNKASIRESNKANKQTKLNETDFRMVL